MGKKTEGKKEQEALLSLSKSLRKELCGNALEAKIMHRRHSLFDVVDFLTAEMSKLGGMIAVLGSAVHSESALELGKMGYVYEIWVNGLSGYKISFER